MIERAKDSLLIIPAFHVATCFIYLFFYYSGFGLGLVYFANPTDIFSVSLGDVAPVYVWLFIGALTSHMIFRHPQHGNVFRFETLTTEEQQRQRPTFLKLTKFMNRALFATASFPAIIAILYYIASGFFNYIFISIALQIYIILLSGWILDRFSLSKPQYDILSITLLVLSALMTSALSDAQSDKHWRYKDYNQPQVRCNDILVLRNVSELSLAVRKDNSRILIDLDCNQKFIVSSAEQFRPIPDGAPAKIIARLF